MTLAIKHPFILTSLAGVMLMWSFQINALSYRDDAEPVMAAPASVPQDDRPEIEGFARRYKAHHSPRIVLFWNRELSDKVQQHKVQTETTESADRYGETETTDTTHSGTGQNQLRELDGFRKNFTVKKTEETVEDDNHRQGLNEKTEFILRRAVMDKLGAAGVRFIDRSLMIRTTAARQGSDNAQAAETHGVLSQADWIMEVLIVPDPQAPLGVGFRVALKNPRTSTLLSEFYSTGRPVIRQNRRFVAVHGGFEREPPRKANLDDIADALANEILHKFQQTL